MRVVAEEEQEEQEELRWKEARRKIVISQYIHPRIRDEMKEARKQAVREEEQGRTGRGKVEGGQEAGCLEEEKGGMVREIGI